MKLEDLPFTWRQFLTILVEGIASVGKGADPAGALKVLQDYDRGEASAAIRERLAPYQTRVADLEAQVSQVKKDESLSAVERQRRQGPLQDDLEKAQKEAFDAYWDPVVEPLEKVKGYKLDGILILKQKVGDEAFLDDDLHQLSPEQRLFFLIEYSRGTVIMQKGTFSDYAALHQQGVVRICTGDLPPETRKEKNCLDVPRTWLGRAISRLLSFGRHDKSLPTAPYEGSPEVIQPAKDLPGIACTVSRKGKGLTEPLDRDFVDRLMGVTSVVWKQRRTATLIADNDDKGQPCQMVLIKRKILQNCLLFKGKQETELYQRKLKDFFKESLPGLLARNRLFRPLFYVEEVKKWEALLKRLTPTKHDQTVLPAQRVIIQGLSSAFRKELGGLEASQLNDDDRDRVVSKLNDFLDRPDLYDAKAWPNPLPQEEQDLLKKEPKTWPVVETYRLNRLLIEAAFPGEFQSIRNLHPRTTADFEAVARQIWQPTSSAATAVDEEANAVPGVEQVRGTTFSMLTPLRLVEGAVIFEEGKPADGLYLILEGRVRLNLENSGKQVVFNHLVEDGFFGESCIEKGSDARHLYQAMALTNCTLLKIERPTVLALANQSSDFKNKLVWEAERMRRRANQVRLVHRLPPADLPPPETTAKLMRATNLLVIDMDRCTRCDQCVQACTESHQGQPRFHRANPGFRIDQWEVAGACVHCSDAPCLEACPVGAIIMLENGTVQVLRDRCISCRNCARECPFGVIEYHKPIDTADGASAKPNDYVVANKCDLCLTPERDPPCVVACPYGAAKRGDPSTFFKGLKSTNRFTDPE